MISPQVGPTLVQKGDCLIISTEGDKVGLRSVVKWGKVDDKNWGIENEAEVLSWGRRTESNRHGTDVH